MQKKVRLFEASRDAINEIAMIDLPQSLEAAIGKDELGKQLQAHSSSGMSEKTGKKIFHGQGVGSDHYKENILHFFREVDKSLNKTLVKKDYPLVIAGVEYLLPLYKEANKYPKLIEKGITGNPEKADLHELHKKSLPIVASYYLKS